MLSKFYILVKCLEQNLAELNNVIMSHSNDIYPLQRPVSPFNEMYLIAMRYISFQRYISPSNDMYLLLRKCISLQ